MWIRWKEWERSNTGMKFPNDPRQSCFFSKEDNGCVDVRYKQVLDQLLAHPNLFEPAWDRFGIGWDEEGHEIKVTTAIEPKTETAGNGAESSTDSAPEAAKIQPQTRVAKKKPRFKSVSERMAYIRSRRKSENK